MTDQATIAELRRIRRVADQSCSAHARLRDRYSLCATMLDTVVLCASAWVAAVALIDPKYAAYLTPPGIVPGLWIGLLSIAAFIATLVQLKLDFKGRSDAHRRAFEAQTEIKFAAGDAERYPEDETRVASVYAKLALAAGVGVSIPESESLPQKAGHLRKVQVSKLLDKRPFATLPLVWLQLWWRDNVGRAKPWLELEIAAPAEPSKADSPQQG
jgi:hypothetical protein